MLLRTRRWSFWIMTEALTTISLCRYDYFASHISFGFTLTCLQTLLSMLDPPADKSELVFRFPSAVMTFWKQVMVLGAE